LSRFYRFFNHRTFWFSSDRCLFRFCFLRRRIAFGFLFANRFSLCLCISLCNFFYRGLFLCNFFSISTFFGNSCVFFVCRSSLFFYCFLLCFGILAFLGLFLFIRIGHGFT